MLAIPLHVFGVLTMNSGAEFAVLPMAGVAAVLMLERTQLGRWAWKGFVAGLLAVAAYDAVRLPMVVIGWWPDFIPRLGGWVLITESSNAFVGYLWRYIGDGAGMGLSYFVVCSVLVSSWPQLVRRRPVALSIGYGIFVWSGLMGTILLSTQGAHLLFALTPISVLLSLLGHLVYGAVLGLCLRRACSDLEPAGAPEPRHGAKRQRKTLIDENFYTESINPGRRSQAFPYEVWLAEVFDAQPRVFDAPPRLTTSQLAGNPVEIFRGVGHATARD